MTAKEEYIINKYEITEDGKVFSTFNSNNNFQRKELKYREDRDGYLDVGLVYNDKGGRQPFRIHRLVACKYIPNPNNLPVINHKDLDKKNNNLDNLQWSSVAYNTQHGYDNSAYSNVKSVKVIEDKNIVKIFPSTSHASRYYEYSNPTTIQNFLKNSYAKVILQGKCKGYSFEYTEEETTHINYK